jgi:1-acyl-sn-glycerol-3-phosphate acyltransferase
MSEPKDWQYRPARDLGLKPTARLKSVSREAGLLGVAFSFLWWTTMRGYALLFHRPRVAGSEYLPEPPFVLIANHASHLDTIMLATRMRLRFAHLIHPLAAGDTFFDDPASSMFAATALNALPVWRGRTRRAEIAALRARLVDERCIFILFPEGTRTRTGAMAPFKPGLGALVAGLDVAVVPAWLDGCFAALPPQRKFPRPLPIAVRFGPALNFASEANDADGWERIAATAEAAVRGLRTGPDAA